MGAPHSDANSFGRMLSSEPGNDQNYAQENQSTADGTEDREETERSTRKQNSLNPNQA